MEISRGEITKTVYSLIKDEKFNEAVEILEQLLDLQPCSRSGLSLVGYCYFQLQDFENAATTYDRLTSLCPDIPEYQFYLAQSLYNETAYDAALDASLLKGDPDSELQDKVVKLQAAIQYCNEEIEDAQTLVDKCSKTDPDFEVNSGCLEYKVGNFREAALHFEKASQMKGFDSQLWYNRAVTFYQMGDIPSAGHYLGEIIEQGVMIHPEFGVGYKLEDKDSMLKVGNSTNLHKTALIEALNLKAAIEQDIGKPTAAQETLQDLPPRNDVEIDPITLHNLAILNMKTNPVEGIRKLRYLLDQISFPPETFRNLLILYSRYEQYDMIADLMAVYGDFNIKYLTPDIRSFFEALTKREPAPNEAVKLLDELCNRLTDSLRKLVKEVEDSKSCGSEEEAKKICNRFDDLIDGTYMPAIMAMGKIFWDREDLVEVERLLRQGCEFLDDKDCWLTNVAHTIYIRGQNYSEAAGLYETVVRKYSDRLLDVSAISLANLSVCYVLISQNEEAERLIRNIELQESALMSKFPGVKVFHSCIMNMVIGTLYCVKKNYDFGISRIVKSLEECKTRLGPDTWFYAKRCLISMLEKLVKNSVSITEDVLLECLLFLEECEEFGRDVSTVIEDNNCLPSEDNVAANYGIRTVTYEARYLRYLLIQAMSWGLT